MKYLKPIFSSGWGLVLILAFALNIVLDVLTSDLKGSLIFFVVLLLGLGPALAIRLARKGNPFSISTAIPVFIGLALLGLMSFTCAHELDASSPPQAGILALVAMMKLSWRCLTSPAEAITADERQ